MDFWAYLDTGPRQRPHSASDAEFRGMRRRAVDEARAKLSPNKRRRERQRRPGGRRGPSRSQASRGRPESSISWLVSTPCDLNRQERRRDWSTPAPAAPRLSPVPPADAVEPRTGTRRLSARCMPIATFASDVDACRRPRTACLRPAGGEKRDASDSHGFDFRLASGTSRSRPRTTRGERDEARKQPPRPLEKSGERSPTRRRSTCCPTPSRRGSRTSSGSAAAE